MEDNGIHELFGYSYSSKKIFFSVQQKKEIHTGLDHLEGE